MCISDGGDDALKVYFFAVIASALIVLWLTLYMRYNKSSSFDNPGIGGLQFVMTDLFFIGFGFIELAHIDLKTPRGAAKERRLAELYGADKADFFRQYILAAQLTYVLTMLPAAIFIGCILEDFGMMMIIGIVLAVLAAYPDIHIGSKVNKRREQILDDYPAMLSQLTLLVNAGLVIRDAWTRVAYSSDRDIYMEMQRAGEEMRNGISDADALYNFADRCAVREIRKVASVLSQNIQKGGADLSLSLKYMTNESWSEKKHRAKLKGETANTKLMLPLMIMFSGVLIMIIVPMFADML